MVELNRPGAKPLVDMRTHDKMAIVIQEILQDKIYLDNSSAVAHRNMSATEQARQAMAGDVSGDM
jgi:DNA-directed RNA polymerase subunit omega